MADFVQARSYTYAGASQQTTTAAQQSNNGRIAVKSYAAPDVAADKPHGIPLLGAGIAAGVAALAGAIVEVIRIAGQRRSRRK